jgi:hypothetical protein
MKEGGKHANDLIRMTIEKNLAAQDIWIAGKSTFPERIAQYNDIVASRVSSLRCQASTCLRTGSKFRCIRSTSTGIQSMSENDFECFASTGVKSPLKAKWPGLAGGFIVHPV